MRGAAALPALLLACALLLVAGQDSPQGECGVGLSITASCRSWALPAPPTAYGEPWLLFGAATCWGGGWTPAAPLTPPCLPPAPCRVGLPALPRPLGHAALGRRPGRRNAMLLGPGCNPKRALLCSMHGAGRSASRAARANDGTVTM